MNTYHKLNHWQLPLLAIMVPLVLVSCGDTKYTGPIPLADASYYNGYWEQKGYGQYVEITPESITRYEAATDSCIKTHSLQRGEFPGNLNWTITSADDDSFLAYMNNDTSDELNLNRISGLPASCDTPRSNTPSNVVNHLIAMADEYYAFFNERNIDWDAATSQARAAVRDDMTDQELIEVVAGLLSVFNDAHVLGYFNAINLLEPVVDFNYFGVFVEEDNLQAQLIKEYLESLPSISFEAYEAEQTTLYHSIINSYMVNDLEADGGLEQDKIKWGTINPDIGYLQIGELDGLNPDHAGDFLSEAANPAPHLEALNVILDRAITELQQTSAIVLDLRLHSGGTTVLDRGIARRFIEKEINYGSFSAQGGESVPLVLQPYAGSRLAQPIIVITSGFNASSGEDLIMAMKANSNITQIGEQTLGTFSDQLFLSLPNQWAFSLSNEVWLDKDGIGWEGAGLQPDHELDVFAIADRQQGMDTAIERALSLSQ